jgi:hypothetical protein
MCDGDLGNDLNVTINGNEQAVKFSVIVGIDGNISESSSSITVSVDWDSIEQYGIEYSEELLIQSGALFVINAAVQGIQVWYNVSKEMPTCIDWGTPAPTSSSARRKHDKFSNFVENLDSTTCTATNDQLDALTAWDILSCNEGVNLVNWRAQGVGNDLYWPPNQPKGFSLKSTIPGSFAYCAYYSSIGLYGIPLKRDDWAMWIDTAYGGKRLQYASNIVFSNGNLDPWNPAGVIGNSSLSQDSSILSLLIDMGGHHLDLFWPTDSDPESVRFSMFKTFLLVYYIISIDY